MEAKGSADFEGEEAEDMLEGLLDGQGVDGTDLGTVPAEKKTTPRNPKGDKDGGKTVVVLEPTEAAKTLMKEITANLGDASKQKQRLKDEPLAEEANRKLEDHVDKMQKIYEALRAMVINGTIKKTKDFKAQGSGGMAAASGDSYFGPLQFLLVLHPPPPSFIPHPSSSISHLAPQPHPSPGGAKGCGGKAKVAQGSVHTCGESIRQTPRPEEGKESGGG